jgi:signal transduction histidine kinase
MNQRFNLREALDEIVLSYELNLQHCKLALLLNVSKQTPHHIICDKMRLQQIINNLLSNAIKFARSRIYVEVEYIKERDLLQVIVTDDGFGFSFDNMGYIMDCMSLSSEIKK